MVWPVKVPAFEFEVGPPEPPEPELLALELWERDDVLAVVEDAFDVFEVNIEVCFEAWLEPVLPVDNLVFVP